MNHCSSLPLQDAREVYGIRRDLVPKLKESGRLPEGVEP